MYNLRQHNVSLAIKDIIQGTSGSPNVHISWGPHKRNSTVTFHIILCDQYFGVTSTYSTLRPSSVVTSLLPSRSDFVPSSIRHTSAVPCYIHVRTRKVRQKREDSHLAPTIQHVVLNATCIEYTMHYLQRENAPVHTCTHVHIHACIHVHAHHTHWCILSLKVVHCMTLTICT